jgi:hypothetical protein
MFPEGRQLPLLRHISFNPTEDADDLANAEEWCIDEADIGCIAACCTGLHWLELSHVVKPGEDVCRGCSNPAAADCGHEGTDKFQ